MRLDWPECYNARDLGGLRSTEGRAVRTGALIRSDRLDRLTGAGVAAVRAYGVSRIVDLRSAAEVSRHPGPFAADPVYRHVPFIDEQADLRRDRIAEATLVATYLGGLRRNRARIGAGLAAVIGAPPGGVLVHCAAGKDRTGILVALVLHAIGVPDEAIAEEYALTAELMAGCFAAELAGVDETRRAALIEVQSARPETILAVLSFVRDRYGGTQRYLAGAGVSAPRLATLRDRLLR